MTLGRVTVDINKQIFRSFVPLNLYGMMVR